MAQESFGRKLARPPSTASVFETTIRVLGGLLGAYELSRDAIFATRARQIGDAVYAKIDPATGSVPGSFGGRAGSCPSLAHAGTVQLEMLYLARITNDDKYARRARAFYEFQRRQPNLDGLYPQCVGGRTGKLTLGAEADSFYEYLPKVWLLRGGPAARLAALTYARAARSWSWIASAGSRAASASAAASAAARARDATVDVGSASKAFKAAILRSHCLTKKSSLELRGCAGSGGRPGARQRDRGRERCSELGPVHP